MSLIKILKNDIKNNLLISEEIDVYKDKNKLQHLYSYEDIYESKYKGFLNFSFNNENAWFWNKNIVLDFKLNDEKIKLNDLFTDFKEIELIENENILVSNIKNKFNFLIKLNKGDKLEWSFTVENNNSIDFNLTFRMNYLEILKKSLEENKYLEDEIVIKKYYIETLEKKNKEFEKNSLNSQGKIDELKISLRKLEEENKSLKEKLSKPIVNEKKDNFNSFFNDNINLKINKKEKTTNFSSIPENNYFFNYYNKNIDKTFNPWTNLNFDYPYKRTRNGKYYGK
jgi:hypothetical protein